MPLLAAAFWGSVGKINTFTVLMQFGWGLVRFMHKNDSAEPGWIIVWVKITTSLRFREALWSWRETNVDFLKKMGNKQRFPLSKSDVLFTHSTTPTSSLCLLCGSVTTSHYFHLWSILTGVITPMATRGLCHVNISICRFIEHLLKQVMLFFSWKDSLF